MIFIDAATITHMYSTSKSLACTHDWGDPVQGWKHIKPTWKDYDCDVIWTVQPAGLPLSASLRRAYITAWFMQRVASCLVAKLMLHTYLKFETNARNLVFNFAVDMSLANPQQSKSVR